VLNWQLKTFSEIQTMNPYSEEVIIVGMYLIPVQYVLSFLFFILFNFIHIWSVCRLLTLPGITENQQLVLCNELEGKRVSNLNSAYL
jgi:hypothetical protein